jgi:uncharacterized protein YecE (DUF72 family)
MSGSATNKPEHLPACKLWVGTSGYSYAEWTEAGFYPSGTQPGKMLPFYARNFSIIELNYTWYQMPKAQALERMCAQVPPEFRFTAKLTRSLTHEVDPDQWRSQAMLYREGILPLVQSGQLAAILVQFPPAFNRVAGHRRYLADLLDVLEGLPVAVEFRHHSWAKDRVFTGLENRRITLVTLDMPPLPGLFPPLDVVTNPDLLYVRLHGRNTRGWRSGNMQKQFDYYYSEAELQTWLEEYLEKMASRAKHGVIFFNNHVRAQAPANARSLIDLLAKQGLAAVM